MHPKLDTEKKIIYHSREKKGERRHTLIGVITPDNKLRIGHSITPKYAKFTKKLNRTIAHGRALKSPQVIVDIKNKKPYEINELFKSFTKVFVTKCSELFDKNKY